MAEEVGCQTQIGSRPGTINEGGFDFDTDGLTAGIDYRFTDRLNLGAALGYRSNQVKLRGDAGELDVEGLSLSLYGTYYTSHLYVDGMLSFGQSDLEMQRVIDFAGSRHVAHGAPAGDQLAASLGLGYDGQRGAWTIGGFGRVDWVDSGIDAYRESGAPGLDLEIGKQQVESLLGSVGVQLSYAASLGWGILSPTFRCGAVHEFADDSRPLAASFVDDPGRTIFVVATDEPDRDYFNVGLGLAAVFPRDRQAFLFYEQDLSRRDFSFYLITAGLRFAF